MSSNALATQLTDQQRLFVENYLDCGNAKQAAIQAGYAIESADRSAWRLLQKDQVSYAILARVRPRLARGIPERLKTLDDMAAGRIPADRGQLDAIKTWLDRSGVIAPKAQEAKGFDRPAHELTVEELEDLIFTKAKPISARLVQSDDKPNDDGLDVLG